MRIIHIATFKGNVGDRINHNGFYKALNDIYNDLEITQIELRDFYFSAKEQKYFNIEFAKKINEYDLCIFGGGGFFDAQWLNSATGVTLNLSNDFVNEIKIPVIVNAMGYHEYPGVTNEEICARFQKFLLQITSKKNWYITVRNDGSYERLLDRYGKEVVHNIKKVPDNGFFCDFLVDDLSVRDETTIGMCITNDLFSEEYNKNVDTSLFNKHIAEFINKQVLENRKIILFPHTPNDVNVISELFSYIDNEAKRNNIIVAPYDASSDSSITQLGYYYKRCACIIGMRFHSLITAINLKVPAIALSGHRQMEALFEDLGMSNYCVKVDNLNFTNHLEEHIDYFLSNREETCATYDRLYNSYLEELYMKYKKSIQEFVEETK